MKFNDEALMDFKDVKSKLVTLDKNPLFRFFSRRVGVDLMLEAFKMYGVGTVSIWGEGSPAFWYKDMSGKVKSVKVEAFKEETGKPRPIVPHMQRIYNPELDILEEHCCFFGEHLLNQKPGVPVMVVPDERSAIFCGRGIKDYVWLATGEPFFEASRYLSEVLRGRDVVYITTAQEMVPYVKRFYSENINSTCLVLDDKNIPSMKPRQHEDLTDLLYDINTRYEVLELLHPESIQRLLGKEAPEERRSSGIRR